VLYKAPSHISHYFYPKSKDKFSREILRTTTVQHQSAGGGGGGGGGKKKFFFCNITQIRYILTLSDY